MNRHRHRIIVEGMDASGKTTLINQLVARNPDMYVVPGLGANADFNTRIPELLDEEANGRIPVHDRFFFSELVYGPVLRGKIAIEDTLVQNTAWFLRNTAFLVYVRPDTRTMGEQVAKTHINQMDGVVRSFHNLIEAYDQIMRIEQHWFTTRFFHYDWTREGALEQLETALAPYLKQ